MQIPEGAYADGISDYQFRLLAVLCRLQPLEGVIEASIAELGSLTGGASEKTVRRALIALEKHGYIEKTATKQANGYRGQNTYRVSPKCPISLDKNDHTNCPISMDKNDRTSPGYVTIGSSDINSHKSLVPNGQNNQISNKLKTFEASETPLKKMKVPMRENYDDGDDLAGFGLVEPRDVPQKKISRRDPKTRGRRPQHEWTAMDVAAEFSYLVAKKYPILPGTVNVKALSGALAKFRNQYGTTALIELELLRLFMADESNFKHIGDEAPHLYKSFLASFGKRMNQARENLGLPRLSQKETPTPSATVAPLVASDGRVFQNSMSGRAQLQRHEARLKQEGKHV
jgi:hypothetical protein